MCCKIIRKLFMNKEIYAWALKIIRPRTKLNNIRNAIDFKVIIEYLWNINVIWSLSIWQLIKILADPANLERIFITAQI